MDELPLIVAVCVGNKYPPTYVYNLRRMVSRHLTLEHEFIVLTDRPEEFDLPPESIEDVSDILLSGWWMKMALFRTKWREGHRVVYFDLDTLIVGDLDPLVSLDVDFAICQNFTRLAGNRMWPCKYGSCAMVIGPDLPEDTWLQFARMKSSYMKTAGNYGDQFIIEKLIPEAPYLQDLLPSGYFMGYRDLYKYPKEPPKECSIVVFAGGRTPDKFGPSWCKKEWQ